MPLHILATSDLHLGRKSADLALTDESSSVKYTWNRIIKYAIGEQIDLLLLTGDIVDEENAYFEARGPLKTGFQELARAGIPVVMVAGNHDYDVLAQLLDHNKWDNVHLLGRNGNWEYLPLRVQDIDLGFAGWSFPQRHVNADPLLTFENISGQIEQDRVNIGLLHGDLDAQDSSYAPIAFSSLRQIPLDIWILGHIHKAQLLHESPLILYPGSPHALSAAEPLMHGPALITVHDKHHVTQKLVPLSPVRYENITVDVVEELDKDTMWNWVMEAVEKRMKELAQELHETRNMICTIFLEGEHPDPPVLDQWLEDLVQDYEEIYGGRTTVRVRKVHNLVDPAVGNLQDLAQQPSPAGRLARNILSIERNEPNAPVLTMVEEWMAKTGGLKRAETYKPLRDAERISAQPSKEEALAYILRESKTLLNHLVRNRAE